ncbi:hypothetical protein fugu_018466 [Takifugu bimaculatus]|nr:hypothetical protein fugu_018466 [Takifugu bimaculatus]
MVKDAFWDYVAKVTLTAEESLNQIRQSELGQEVNAKFSESADKVNQYVVALRTQATPLTQDFITKVSQEAEQLKTRLETELSAMTTNLQPYSDMLVKLQAQLEEMKKETASLAEAMDAEALRTILQHKSHELKKQLEHNAKELQAQMVPYTEEMKNKMEQSLEDFHSSLMPIAQSFESQLNQKTQEIQQSLMPYGEELKAKLDSSAQDVQAQLAALWEAFTKKTQ